MADDYNADGYNWDNTHEEYLRGWCHASGNFVLWVERKNGWDETYHNGECIYYQLDREEE
jgi:hypothetical protein